MSSHPPQPRPLIATYRLQLRSGLTLDEVRRRWLRPLADLGVSHLYLSPVFRATAGSTHGYDVVDPGVVDECLADDGFDGDGAFDALVEAAHDLGLGVVVDLVPNHVATDHDRNERWWDLLRNGPASAAAVSFDLDWEPPERRLRGRLLLPVLPDHYGRELERGAFAVTVETRFGRPEPVVVHPSATLPIELASMAPLLRSTRVDALVAVADDAERLPGWSLPHDPDALAHRRAAEPELRRRLGDALTDPQALAAMEDAATALTSDIESLDALLDAQPYRPARWQTSLDDLGYRRFFDINTLVGVRVDRPEVFDRTHALVRAWVERGAVDGLRVDHVDGLRDPAGYVERLRSLAPDSWIVVEKILGADEQLPPWPIDGTTGYEVAELLARLDLDDEGRPTLERIAAEAGAPVDVPATLDEAKGDVLDELLAADVNRVTESLLRICERRRRVRDVTRRELHATLVGALRRLDVYRTYVRPDHPTSEADRARITADLDAVAELADDAGGGTDDPEIVALLRTLLPGGAATAEEWDLVLRFQQLSGPTMAKGAEDTAWFRLATLASRCEVGADPDRWGIALDVFHDAMAERQRTWPLAMTGTTSHDTKRSEDVRARLALASQDATAWSELVERWTELSAPTAPDSTSDLQLLQAMVGAWPIGADRLGEHLLKTVREAKVHTSWLRPDLDYESAVAAHVTAMCEHPDAVALVDRWVADHDDAWRVTVLAQKLLALTVPGVPDLYQGSEAILLRLTDPDNRARVDPPAAADDQAKTALVRAALHCRRRHPGAFGAGGDYEPLWAAGPRADHAVAFVRHGAGEAVAIVAPRRAMGVADGWRGTSVALPDGVWGDELRPDRSWTGAIDLDELLGGDWPVALLTRRG